MESNFKFFGIITEYSCIVCGDTVCVVCADASNIDEIGYSEENHEVWKCPRDSCQKRESEVADMEEGQEIPLAVRKLIYLIISVRHKRRAVALKRFMLIIMKKTATGMKTR